MQRCGSWSPRALRGCSIAGRFSSSTDGWDGFLLPVVDPDLQLPRRGSRRNQGDRLATTDQLADDLRVGPAALDMRLAHDDPARRRVARGLVNVGKVITRTLD